MIALTKKIYNTFLSHLSHDGSLGRSFIDCYIIITKEKLICCTIFSPFQIKSTIKLNSTHERWHLGEKDAIILSMYFIAQSIHAQHHSL